MPTISYEQKASLNVYDANVYDKDGNVIFKVNSKMASWGADVSVTDADDKELFHVKQTGSVLKAAFGSDHGFEVTKDGNAWGEVKKTSGTLASEKKVVGTFSDIGEIEATGSQGWISLECDFTRGGEKIGDVKKAIKNFVNVYTYEFDNEEDKLAIVAMAVCLDRMFHTHARTS